MLVSERLDQVDQVGVLHFLWSEDVPLVQLLHGLRPVNNNNVIGGYRTEQNPGAGMDSCQDSQDVCV